MDLDVSKMTEVLLKTIPKLKTRIHLVAYALVIVLLVFLNYDGIRVLPSALALATIPVVIIATYFPTLTPRMGDLTKIICLFIILLFPFLLIGLAFYYDNKEKTSDWISWEGKMEFRHLIDPVDRRSHIDFKYSAENSSDTVAKQNIRSLVLCPVGNKFSGKDEFDLFREISWRYRNCLSSKGDTKKKVIHLRLLDKTGTFKRVGKCDICEPL